MLQNLLNALNYHKNKATSQVDQEHIAPKLEYATELMIKDVKNCKNEAELIDYIAKIFIANAVKTVILALDQTFAKRLREELLKSIDIPEGLVS